LGLILAFIFAHLDYHLIIDHAAILYGLCLLGLVGTLIISHPVEGARRWLTAGGFTFQMSEMAKLVIIICVAAYFAGRRVKTVGFKDLAALGLIAGLPALLVVLEPDLGTAITFFPSVLAGVYLAGIRLRQLGLIVAAAVLLAPVGWHFMHPYQRQRLMTFVHPTANQRGTAYQVTQSKIAIGSGGFWGKGFKKGTQTRLGFVPVSHADFIFAAFAEEQGFAGTSVVLLLYLVLLVRLLDGARNAGDRAGAYFVVGLAAVLGFQVVVNVGMMIGFLPITGIPLPLMSQGGSAVLFTFIGLGLALSVRRQRFVN
jgi:rod shape determining protein RodA